MKGIGIREGVLQTANGVHVGRGAKLCQDFMSYQTHQNIENIFKKIFYFTPNTALICPFWEYTTEIIFLINHPFYRVNRTHKPYTTEIFSSNY